MANYAEPKPGAEEEYVAWCATRPDAVRVAAERLRPWRLYRMRSTGQRVVMHCFEEHTDGSAATVKVAWLGRFDRVAFDQIIFGVDPADLEECDLPAPGEKLGEIYDTREKQRDYINGRRALNGLPPMNI